jgi:predicted adenine nucleotide alpha hydrolase (AANH) superfamily ATPase
MYKLLIWHCGTFISHFTVRVLEAHQKPYTYRQKLKLSSQSFIFTETEQGLRCKECLQTRYFKLAFQFDMDCYFGDNVLSDFL